MTTERKKQTTYTDAQLRYAATARCPCGAGLAYPKDSGIQGAWDCADILTGRAIPKDRPGFKQHTAALPFAFYEVKSEDQPSANGATTRPAETPEEAVARHADDERQRLRARVDGAKRKLAEAHEVMAAVTGDIWDAFTAGYLTKDEAAALADEASR